MYWLSCTSDTPDCRVVLEALLLAIEGNVGSGELDKIANNVSLSQYIDASAQVCKRESVKHVL